MRWHRKLCPAFCSLSLAYRHRVALRPVLALVEPQSCRAAEVAFGVINGSRREARVTSASRLGPDIFSAVGGVRCHVADQDAEAVAAQVAGAELVRVPADAQHADAVWSMIPVGAPT